MKFKTENQKLYFHYVHEKHYKHMEPERMLNILQELNKTTLEDHQHRELKQVMQIIRIGMKEKQLV